MITPPAPMITAADLLKIPGLMRLFLNTFEDANGRDAEEDVAIALAATLIAWPNANKAYFVQGPHLMLPLLKAGT